MNQKRSKQIKKMVYGDFSPRVRKYILDSNGTVRLICKRKVYQQMKRDHQRMNTNTLRKRIKPRQPRWLKLKNELK